MNCHEPPHYEVRVTMITKLLISKAAVCSEAAARSASGGYKIGVFRM